MPSLRRTGLPAVAIETTVLVHGVPKVAAAPLARDLRADAASAGAEAQFVGILAGTPTIGLDDAGLQTLLDAPSVPKANAANLGILIHARAHAATTVSATLELAAAAGIRVGATGGIGGLHRHLSYRVDVSADLGALARHPVALVCSGVKSLLDVEGTRELLEALGVPIVGFRTDRFPAFYRRRSESGVDARFDDVPGLASFVRSELARRTRGILIANPIAEHAEIAAASLDTWLAEAEREAREGGIRGRDVTPFILGRLHDISGGRTLAANIELLRSNTRLAGEIAAALAK